MTLGSVGLAWRPTFSKTIALFLKVISSARVRVNAREGCSLNAAVLVRAASRIASEPKRTPLTPASSWALVGRRKGEEAPRRGEGGESAEG
jgi:hypothetical protein